MTSSNAKKSDNKGVELRIQGTVQGVGFRPFVYNLATQLSISGTVSNTSTGVFIQAVASADRLDTFISRIESEAPPLSRIHSIDVDRTSSEIFGDKGFHILQSEQGENSATAIPPDIGLCGDCLHELLSPDDRRFRYPFTNCTNCGPRFTIVETIPYDRPKTSMHVFPMCRRCRAEYDDPGDRRFHAQPNACPECGPRLSWHDGERLLENVDPLSEAVSLFNADGIVALRGLGGFHLAVNALSEEAIVMLRQRKNRPTKPLAIMARDLDTVREICHISSEEERCLTSPQQPIVLLRKRADYALPPSLCPGVGDIGVMLPYTPLHHLLFQTPKCPPLLVMTSGNHGGRPICTANETALEELGGIADGFLLHNRDILTRVDDSVTKLMQGALRPFRRARGYAPAPIFVPQDLPPVLGCGAGLKNTFCLAQGQMAFLSQHIGDLFNLESFDFYTESIDHHRRLFEIEPEIVVRDLHPDYMSSRYAEELGLPVYTVQHHHAHAVAVMAEHNLEGQALAVVLDGTGYGPDSTIWGGELLLCDLTAFTRLAHLDHLAMPGGDLAAAEPWRMGLSALFTAYGPDGMRPDRLPALLQGLDSQKRDIIAEMLQQQFNSPLTSSCGRLFDAVAALLNLRLYADYEGHAAMELEALAGTAQENDWRSTLDAMMAREDSPFFTLGEGKGKINSAEFVKMIAENIAKGYPASRIALDFHQEVICAISMLVTAFSKHYSTKNIVLSGGCLQNRLLMEGLFHTLGKAGLQVHTGQEVPVNDGGIAFGQVITGGLQHVSRHSDAGDRRQR